MDYQKYKQKASMAYSEKTIQDRKSYIRLFDVWLRGLHGGVDSPEEAVRQYKMLNRNARGAYALSGYEPEDFETIENFIYFLYDDLDYSRTLCRHYFDAIQSYCKRLNLSVYSEDRFARFREDNLDTRDNPNYDETSIFTLDEVKKMVRYAKHDSLRQFITIQYIHCRRPGEVKELQAEDIRLEDGKVDYLIKKQKFGDDNQRSVSVRDQREEQFFRRLKANNEGLIFPDTHSNLEAVRRPFRILRDELGVTDLPLKNLRHSRISHLREVGWEPVEIRDTYTHHKQLSTLQNKYLSSVTEDLTEQELWSMLL